MIDPLRIHDLSSSLHSMLANYQSGKTLEALFYTSEDLFNVERHLFFPRQWVLVGHSSQLRTIGDYFITECFGESIIIVRTAASQIDAFFNVCRHRGAPICLKSSDHIEQFVCPYHGWTYDL